MDLLDSFPDEITKWEVLRDVVNLDLNEDINEDPTKYVLSVQLLPRKSSIIYGNVPKMEPRVFSKCKECRLLFNPRNILSHEVCSGKSHSSSLSVFDLKKKSKNKSSRKSHSNTPSPPPFKKPQSPTTPVTPPVTDLSKLSPKNSKSSTSSSTSSPTNSSTSSSLHKSNSRIPGTHNSKTLLHHIPKTPKAEHSSHLSKSSKVLNNSSESSNGSSSTSKFSSSSSHSSISSSSKHKKSRKSSNSSHSKNNDEYDPTIHCGVIEDNKGPCTRSLSFSNHRSQLRKLVSSRSKEIHHLIAERKALKEKDSKYSNSKSHRSPNGLEAKDTGDPYTLIPLKNNNPSVILPKTMDTFSSQNLTTSNKQILDITDLDIKFSKTAEVLLNHENNVGTVPVVYMPMSPVSVINPVEYVKIGKNILCLESPQSASSPSITTNQSVVLGIPNNINVKMYNSHPKPISLPSYGAKKIGGALVLSKHQLELQRNDLLVAINSNAVNDIEYYRTYNSSNVLCKPNILKNKNNTKSNSYKRSSAEKTTNDNKQMKYSSNLNGFLLHSTISETADAPLSNISISDKINFFNIK